MINTLKNIQEKPGKKKPDKHWEFQHRIKIDLKKQMDILEL